MDLIKSDMPATLCVTLRFSVFFRIILSLVHFNGIERTKSAVQTDTTLSAQVTPVKLSQSNSAFLSLSLCDIQ